MGHVRVFAHLVTMGMDMPPMAAPVVDSPAARARLLEVCCCMTISRDTIINPNPQPEGKGNVTSFSYTMTKFNFKQNSIAVHLYPPHVRPYMFHNVHIDDMHRLDSLVR